MIEIPEAVVIARQIKETVAGKQIAQAVANASPHKFAWYFGDPAEYGDRLNGKTIQDAAGMGPNITVSVDDQLLSISAPIRYWASGAKRPKKHQLLLEFTDGTAISSTAQMWGGFYCFAADDPEGVPYWALPRDRPSPLDAGFDKTYFEGLH